MIDLCGKRVLVTGGNGFFGEYVVDQLRMRGAKPCVTGGRMDYDLRYPTPVDDLFSHYKPEYVIHLAGHNGGIKFNQDFPADIFYDNTVMGLNVIRACQAYGVKKVLSVVASCGYSEVGSEHALQEEWFLDEQPNYTVACHGYAKRNLQLASKFYYDQFKLNAVCACVTTLYGPGDSFDPEKTKVLGALIKKFVDAAHDKAKSVTLWGTGVARRQFIFVEDAAKLLVRALCTYENHEQPINLATEDDVTIKSLAEIIAEVVGYDGEILWDDTKPNGQMRKQLFCNTMYDLEINLDDDEITHLQKGIEDTVEYYRENLVL